MTSTRLMPERNERHAVGDADELLAWMGAVEVPPEMVHVAHGEPAAADALRARVKHELRWNAASPSAWKACPFEQVRRQDLRPS